MSLLFTLHPKLTVVEEVFTYLSRGGIHDQAGDCPG
jgi:hypothetical protein